VQEHVTSYVSTEIILRSAVETLLATSDSGVSLNGIGTLKRSHRAGGFLLELLGLVMGY
jgi:hypothetical protein